MHTTEILLQTLENLIKTSDKNCTLTVEIITAMVADLKEMQEIDKEIRSWHNGFDPDYRALVGAQEPSSLLKAIEELRDEGNELHKMEIDALSRELEDAKLQLACPECQCATPEDADKKGCECKSPICGRDYSKTLAEHFCDVVRENETLKSQVTELSLALERSNETLQDQILVLEKKLRNQYAAAAEQLVKDYNLLTRPRG